MAGNTNPIYTKVGDINGVVVGASALATSDGTATIGTGLYLVYTADATNGSFVQKITFIPVATAAATNTNATVIRVYVSSITSGSATPSNTWNIGELSAPVQSAANSTTAVNPLVMSLGFMLPPSYTILASSHAVNAASTSWIGSVFAGKY